jgi:putative ABC transport system permease protein
MITADLRYAFRTLIAGRVFTAVAVTCLALAIATNTTMFSVFDAMFLRPLPFPAAERLVAIAGRHPESGRRVALSPGDVRGLAASVHSLDAIAAYAGRTVTLTDGAEPERIGTQQITATLFPMLGASPLRGRSLDSADERAGGVALIADSLWRRRYQADPAAIGRLIHLDAVPYTVVGVMPPGFRFPSTSELWTPLALDAGSQIAAARVSVLARLRLDATLRIANAELGARALPAAGSRPARVAVARSYASANVGGEERLIISALMGATTVLLIMACVNIANLLLARGARRRREFAVRAAIGASRWRLARQLLSESVLLAFAAAGVAMPLAWYGIHWVHQAVPPTEPLGPYYTVWSLDLRTFLYAIAIALLTGVAFGLAPAFEAAGRSLASPLRDGAGAVVSRVQRRIHSALIVVQIALTLVLLAGASLFVRTYAGLHRVELGYDSSHLMTLRVYLAGSAYDLETARARAVDAIAARLESVAGAHAATVTDLVPLDDQGGSDATAAIEGQTFESGREPSLHYAGVAGRWLETFNVPLIRGRNFDDDELRRAAPVALVNAKLAATFWPGEDPIGRRFRPTDESSRPWMTVIGVVPDIRTVKLDESRATPPTAYLPQRFISTRNYGIVVRTRSAPESVVTDVRTAVHAIDPGLALFDVYPLEQVRWLSYWMYVMWGTMFGVLGGIALTVAAVGVYGVVFYTVEQRTREIGVRVALGASRAQVVGPILRHVGALTAVGIAIGLGGAAAVTPLVGSLLISVTPNDPAGYAAVALGLGGIALAATWLPAWRASAVDPVAALRDE